MDMDTIMVHIEPMSHPETLIFNNGLVNHRPTHLKVASISISNECQNLSSHLKIGPGDIHKQVKMPIERLIHRTPPDLPKVSHKHLRHRPSCLKVGNAKRSFVPKAFRPV